MSIFSRRRKFRNLVSSAISTVVLSSCASQVAQCWPFHIGFSLGRGKIFMKFVRVEPLGNKLQCCNEYLRIFTISMKSVIRFYGCTEDKEDKSDEISSHFLSFSPEKVSEVEKLVGLLKLYLEGCTKLFSDLRHMVGDEDAFFEMLDLKKASARKKYNSLKLEDQTRVNDLRELSNEIRAKYDDISYKISDVFFDGGETLYIVADNPDNVYINNENFKSEKFQSFLNEHGIKCLKSFRILKEDCHNVGKSVVHYWYRNFETVNVGKSIHFGVRDAETIMAYLGQPNQILDREIKSEDVRCYGYKCGANMELDSDLDAYFKSEIDTYLESDKIGTYLDSETVAYLNEKPW